MHRLKNLLYVFIILGAVTLATTYGPRLVAGDSGFDSSYDSGGSSGGSSSWDSGSSWDHSSGGSSSGEGDLLSGIIIFVIFAVIIIVYFIYLDKASQIQKTKLKSKIKDNRKELEEIKNIIPGFDEEAFKNDRYNDFVKLQEAWMNFDYDTIRTLVTDELYNQYNLQLETLKVKNQVNVMKDFTYYDMGIKNASLYDDELTVTTEMKVSFIDYISRNNRSVRGSSKKKIFMHYQLKYVCKINNNVDTCPHCGAKINNSASQVCNYCKGTISGISSDWVLSKKQALHQDFE